MGKCGQAFFFPSVNLTIFYFLKNSPNSGYDNNWEMFFKNHELQVKNWGKKISLFFPHFSSSSSSSSILSDSPCGLINTKESQKKIHLEEEMCEE